ncbi:MlaE family ABC transporter permease [Variovorax sp. ZT4R33]|uniref:MlaE family ABC transporter permease n=1 Tax=Variovorax sp. ZT4R33 TaxID=3443743 RepID=UPI003F460944
MPLSAPNTAPATLTAAPNEPVRAPPRVARGGEGAAVAEGQWTALAFSSRQDWTVLADSLHALPNGDVAWDLRPIEQLDHIGAQVLWRHWGGTWPQRIEMDPPHKAVLEHVARFTCAAPSDAGPTLADRLKAYAHHGPRALAVARDLLRMIGQLVLDIGTLVRAPHRAPWRDLSGQLYQFGTTALPITALVGALIGVVLAYLMSNQLRNFGAEAFMVNILGLSLIRELGPVLAAVLVAGRSGSAITAQIGVMRVTEELDAMRVMGIPHGYRLVMPRVLALAIAMPLISMWTSMAALAGGMVAANLTLDLSPAYFMQALPRAVPLSNLWLSLGKSAVFGVLIALVGCYFGMKVKPNTESLGRGTTSSVVTSITVVILVDALFAVLFRSVGFR